MPSNRRGARILIYSHDSFGLGHLRRCRSIAQSLVAKRKQLSVLILSGSPIIGSFDFPTRVDFVRIPGVIKLRNGAYSSLSLHMNISEVLRLRESIIRHTAETFQPDIFMVDKEPLGLRGEIEDTLNVLKARGTRLVMGLRDVMDDPKLLEREWRRKNPIPALRDLYDDILVFGLPQICETLKGLDIPQTVADKVKYTGYLRRELPARLGPVAAGVPNEPYVLVVTGGGGDGEDVVDWVLSAYEAHPEIRHPAMLVFGPFMDVERRESFQARADRLERVSAITFDAHIEGLVENALGIVAMGGYNTFCEILSFDKPALVVPRTRPRLEQFIRASRAQDLGLLKMLCDDDGVRPPEVMARALDELPEQPKPSQVVIPGLLDGHDQLYKLVEQWLKEGRAWQDESARSA